MNKIVPMESLWTVKEVAAFMKVSANWVYSQTGAGKLPCIRMGSMLRFDPNAIREFLARQVSGPFSLVNTGAR